jgi:hypothetical protein
MFKELLTFFDPARRHKGVQAVLNLKRGLVHQGADHQSLLDRRLGKALNILKRIPALTPQSNPNISARNHFIRRAIQYSIISECGLQKHWYLYLRYRPAI